MKKVLRCQNAVVGSVKVDNRSMAMSSTNPLFEVKILILLIFACIASLELYETVHYDDRAP